MTPAKEEAKQTNDLANQNLCRKKPRVATALVLSNPVTNGSVNVSFADQPEGKYQVQLLDLNGKLISTQEVNIAGKYQVHNLNIPDVAKGNYLIKLSVSLIKFLLPVRYLSSNDKCHFFQKVFTP